MAVKVGDRVRITKCVWPERDGCEGVIVAPPSDGMYPQPSKHEVLVKLDDDPLAAGAGRFWTCCMGVKDVEPIRRSLPAGNGRMA